MCTEVIASQTCGRFETLCTFSFFWIRQSHKSWAEFRSQSPAHLKYYTFITSSYSFLSLLSWALSPSLNCKTDFHDLRIKWCAYTQGWGHNPRPRLSPSPRVTHDTQQERLVEALIPTHMTANGPERATLVSHLGDLRTKLMWCSG